MDHTGYDGIHEYVVMDIRFLRYIDEEFARFLDTWGKSGEEGVSSPKYCGGIAERSYFRKKF